MKPEARKNLDAVLKWVITLVRIAIGWHFYTKVYPRSLSLNGVLRHTCRIKMDLFPVVSSSGRKQCCYIGYRFPEHLWPRQADSEMEK